MTTACALTVGGCGFAKMTLPDGRELVGGRPARTTYLEQMALRYEASQDFPCAEDDIRTRGAGRHRWTVSGCGKYAHYTCEHEDGPGHFEVVFVCTRLR